VSAPAGPDPPHLPATGAAGPPAFDERRPPPRDLLDDCVHCGFCLPTCPTYQLWGQEMDSPRGRIYLMDLAARGEIGLAGPFTEHLDACLGCMACVTSCPSGVRYDRLLESVRPQIERNVRREPADVAFRALVFALFPHRRRLQAAALPAALYRRLRAVPAVQRRLAGRLPARLAALEALLPPVSVREAFARLPERTPATGPRRATVALLSGCVQDVFFHRVNEATVRVLAAEGCDVLVPRGQRCCGALELHAGREDDALRRARATIERFERLGVDRVVTNVAGCGSSMKEYGHLLADDPRWAQRAAAFAATVRDVHEVLADLVAYHDACHLGHAQQVRVQPRAVLGSIPGLELVELAEAALCCGSAGVHNLLHPQAAAELGARKAAHVRAANPDAVVTANPGCLLQLGRHLADGPDGDAGLALLHPVQVLDASIRGVALPRR